MKILQKVKILRIQVDLYTASNKCGFFSNNLRVSFCPGFLGIINI